MKSRGERYSGFWIVALIVLSGLSGCGDDNGPAAPDLPFLRLVANQTVQSTILSRGINYAVLLPEGYDKSSESYPVVYLLHGFGDDETAWYTDGSLQFYVDRYIAETVPMIYVMPQGFNTYYIDRYNGTYPYMDMFVKELVPAIDSKFRTKKDKTQRAVMGYSMGGYGALILPVMHPDVFTISVPLSMSFRTDEQYIAETQGSFDGQWAPNFGPGAGVSGSARLSDYFKARSPFHFFNTADITAFNNLKFMIDCGDDEESLSITNDALHVLMRDHEIPHEYRVRSGAHSWDYWKKSYPEALKFISHAVQGTAYPAEPDPVAIGTPIQNGDYQTVTLPETTLSLNVLTPAGYTTTTTDYPVLYLVHQYENDKRTEDAINVFSLLRNAMAARKIPESIIVEIPAAETTINGPLMEDIVSYIDAEYRTEHEKNGRVVMGNGTGGDWASAVVTGNADLFNSCFLFNAPFTNDTPEAVTGVFYYLDITNHASGYKGYNTIYTQIRNEGIEYEYRVRQGSETYQSFLNGLEESFPVLKEMLK